ncbi:hypothetical protein CR513_39715, partial [Mucuna pruriens]
MPLPVPSKADRRGLSKALSMVRLHGRVKMFMERQGKRYAKRANRDREGKVFVEGELVSTSERRGSPNYFHKGLNLFPVLKLINDNAYVLDYVPGIWRYRGLEFEDKFFSRRGNQDDSQNDLTRTIGESLQGSLTRGKLKKLEAEI